MSGKSGRGSVVDCFIRSELASTREDSLKEVFLATLISLEVHTRFFTSLFYSQQQFTSMRASESSIKDSFTLALKASFFNPD
jgi:hypothetical protein